jgi:hypothetical protein
MTREHGKEVSSVGIVALELNEEPSAHRDVVE